MKRIFFVAALATLAGSSVLAQSSVTIYGRLNVTAEREEVGNVDELSINDNASRLGFIGVEDLGGGLKAGFVLEHRFSADTGMAADTFWVGQSEINLTGNFGMVRAGAYTLESYYATADYVSLHNHDTGTSADFLYMYLVNSDANKISYRTPDFGGFWAEAAVSEAPVSEGSLVLRTYDGAINYSAGSLHVGGGYTKVGDANQWALSGLYEIGAFTFGGYIQWDQDQLGDDRTTFRASGRFNMGASEFHLNYGYADDRSGIGNSSAQQFTAAYNYNLSKRTKLYAYYTRLDNDSGASYYVGSRGGVAGDDFSSLAVGIRHAF